MLGLRRVICANDTILVARWLFDDGAVLHPEWQLPMAGLSSAHRTRKMTQLSSHNGRWSGSCLACWCFTFILADSDFKSKTIDIKLFRYDVLLISMQSVCLITLWQLFWLSTSNDEFSINLWDCICSAEPCGRRRSCRGRPCGRWRPWEWGGSRKWRGMSMRWVVDPLWITARWLIDLCCSWWLCLQVARGFGMRGTHPGLVHWLASYVGWCLQLQTSYCPEQVWWTERARKSGCWFGRIHGCIVAVPLINGGRWRCQVGAFLDARYHTLYKRIACRG